jgi:mannose-6-phosphate isomerase-like protein (cupin superfamily)
MANPKPRPRRVVTGLNAEGKSCVIIDGPVLDHGSPVGLVWRTGEVPADNTSNEDTATERYSMSMMHDGGTSFILTELPVGIGRFMHVTDTVDYMFIISGRGVLELEAGEVEVGPGAFVVDRGVMHSWRVDGPEPLLMANVTIPAKPLGGGRTV